MARTIPLSIELKMSLSQQLDKIVTSLRREDLDATLATLRDTFDDIIQHPNDDKYSEFKLDNKTFIGNVWRYPACEELMKMSGWVVEDDHVRLRDNSHVHIVSQLLELFCKERNDFEKFFPPQEVRMEINATIQYGMGLELKQILNQYDSSVVKCMYVNAGLHILSAAFQARQIGIVQILTNEYGIDANSLNKEGNPCFLELFTGCDSSDICQSLIIEFIKEFNLHVNMEITGTLSPIHCAVLCKMFSLVRFLVEKCSIDVNRKLFSPYNANPLHLAYGTNQSDVAKYLIEHGADLSAIDADGKKPQQYQLHSEESRYSRLSKTLIKRTKIFNKFVSKERICFEEFCNIGIPDHEAVNLTFEKFPELNDKVIHTNPLDLVAIPTMNKLNRYITDMAPSYYSIGLGLDIPNNKLKLIKSDPSLADIQEKCHKMLEVWLETDTSASWKKLCDALEDPEVGLCALAEQIKYMSTLTDFAT